MKVLISLPVHECRRVIDDQLRNLRHFLHEPTVVLHVSQDFAESGNFSAHPGVVVNPRQLRTRWGNVAYLHIANLQYALQAGLEFDFVVFASSNELYIQRGLEEYLRGADAAVDLRGTIGADGVYEQMTPFLAKEVHRRIAQDEKLAAFANEHGIKVCSSQIEGTGYSRSVMIEMLELIERHFGFEHIEQIRYIAEETIFPTVFLALQKSRPATLVKPPTCFVDWRFDLNLARWQQAIAAWRGQASDRWTEDYLTFVEARRPIYSIKWVERTYFDPLRSYVRDQFTPGHPLSDAEREEFLSLDRQYRQKLAEKAAAWSNRWQEAKYFLMKTGSVLLGQRPSYLRFDVLPRLRNWRRRRENRKA